MNEVQDLRQRRNSNTDTDNSRGEASENGHTQNAECIDAAEEAGGADRNDSGDTTPLNLVNGSGSSRLQESSSYGGSEKTSSSALNLVNGGGSRMSQQMSSRTPPPPSIHLHIDPQERPRHNESPVGLLVK